MGPAAVEVPSPHNYLKSHSKESKPAESEFIRALEGVPASVSVI